jgi:peptidoglycan/LPS O-acetylase OafA/YrhL
MAKIPAPPKAKIFFEHLDGLRFFSFFAVFAYHCYESLFFHIKDIHPGLYNFAGFLFKNGNLGVNFFFVLSGFLITYLLIKERELTNKIHVGNFYVRRILRIWPLYYVCLIIGFVLFPLVNKITGGSTQEVANPWYYAFFAANFDMMHLWQDPEPNLPDAITLSVLWSVAVEEQFYLTWPLILSIVPFRKYKYVFPAIMAFSLIFRSFYTGCEGGDHGEDYAVRYFHTFSVIGDMALGGLFAYLCSYESKFKHFVTHMHKGVIALIYMGALGFSLFRREIFPCGMPVIFERIIIGTFFGLIILEQNYAQNSFFKLGNFKIISKLGIYTYGLYCLHLIGIYIALKFVGFAGWNLQNAWVLLFLVVAALLASILISLASYHFFEKWFLKLKDKFAIIHKK